MGVRLLGSGYRRGEFWRQNQGTAIRSMDVSLRNACVDSREKGDALLVGVVEFRSFSLTPVLSSGN